MEPPTPVGAPDPPTPKSKIEKSFNFTSDKNTEFQVIFTNVSKYIQIIASCKKDVISKEYEKIFYLSDLTENKFLSILSSIDDMYEQILLILESKKDVSITEEESQINIIIPIDNFLKVKEIRFTLPEKVKTDKELIKNLLDELTNLKSEFYEKNKKLEEDNKILKEEVKNIKEKLNILMSGNYKFKDGNKDDLMAKEDKIKIIGEEVIKSSSIVNNDLQKQSTILHWIKKKTNKESIKFELIFKMTQHGSSYKDFYKHCGDKGPTLLLIKTDKNRIFGGFTPLNWSMRGECNSLKDKSNQTFIFSLNSMKKFDLKDKNKYAIRCSKYGPNFGNADFFLKEDMKQGESFANGSCNYLSDQNLELTGGKGKSEAFKADEFEVYKVIY